MGEGPLKKVCRRRCAREGSSEKRDVNGRGLVGKRVAAETEAEKVALIPYEEKNNSLIFIN